MDKFGYRFIVHNGDVYFMLIQAFQWRFHWTIDYDTLDFKVLSIVNGRTLEKVERINGTGVHGKDVDYVVGQRVSLPADTKHGVYFFTRFQMLFTVYIQFDENMVPYWNYNETKERGKTYLRAYVNREMREQVRKTNEEKLSKWRDSIDAIMDALYSDIIGKEQDNKESLIGYRFITSNGDLYIMKIEAFRWKNRNVHEYETTHFVVLAIVNARTLERVSSIYGSGVIGIGINYVVGRNTFLYQNRGIYFFRNIIYLFEEYISFDENMIPYREDKRSLKNIMNRDFRNQLIEQMREWKDSINAIAQALDN